MDEAKAKRTRRKHTDATKREAAEAVIKGERVMDVAARYGIVRSLLERWRKAYEAGELSGALGEKPPKAAKGKAAKGTNTKYPVATKRAAVEAVLAGERPMNVVAKYGLPTSLLYQWRKKYEAGDYGPKGKHKGRGRGNGVDASEGRTPEVLFTSRVNQAIVLLRQAWKEVKRLEEQHKIKGPDKAHTLAYVALLELQGDNGS